MENKEEVEKQKKTEDKKSFDYKHIELNLNELLGTKVKIKERESGEGKIEIEYYSPDELDRLLKYLNK